MSLSVSTVRALFLPAVLGAAASVAACQGCRGAPGSSPTATPPTLRLYLLADVAGALEPCGCSKNQLGGLDHLGAFVAKERAVAPVSLVAAAGPLFFLDPQKRGDRALQDDAKADAIADGLAHLGLAAHTPGANDFADGVDALAKLDARAKTTVVACNVALAGAAPFALKSAGGANVAFVGVTMPARMGIAPEGVTVKPPEEALADAVTKAKAAHADVLVGLFAMNRGDALRLVEKTPELTVAVLSKPLDQGEGNDKPAPPVMLGKTLVVQPSNHLQTISVVDLFVRDGSYDFQDAAGVGKTAEREILTARIEELRTKIRRWEQDPKIQKADLDARRADLEKAVDDLRKLETPAPPAKGSFFRVTTQEIRETLGRDDAIYKEMLKYYETVNEENRKAFADRLPKPPGPDGNRFLGIDACTQCHAAAREVWNHTPHASAYLTLVAQHKQFNLDCVSCHVTGYDLPGGSTVTHVDKLEAVQCESCHGPGGKHRDDPTNKALIVGHPQPDFCTSQCHHPPHVEDFDPVAQMHRILGPGHGMPLD